MNGPLAPALSHPYIRPSSSLSALSMVLSFDQSGPGAPSDFGLADVKELALAHGFSKPNDLFQVYGVNALSAFKKKWSAERLPPPGSVAAVTPPSTPTKGGYKARPAHALTRSRAKLAAECARAGRRRMRA